MKTNTPWRRLLTIPVAAALFTLASALAGPAFAAPPEGGDQGACPSSNSLKNYLAASNVGASFTNNGTNTTYQFLSLTNENPVGGVPGLIKYCVYPTPVSMPTAVNVLQAKGANGTAWISSVGRSNFNFGRPGGNSSNIPLDGKTTVMGTATWSSLPTTQVILLHINDPDVCHRLYGSGSPDTCFVKPKPGAICNQGDGETKAAYNAIPLGGVDCPPPSVGFEAQADNELGDQVQLAGTARELVSLKVLFMSWGCESGHWYDGTCVTTPGATFTHPITANIYNPADLVNPIATSTQTFTIPYRPSADPQNCPDPDTVAGSAANSRWFNPANGVAGACQNAIGTLLTFAFPAGTTLDDNVIWTVEYNTSHSGYNPIAQPLGPGDSCSSSPGGCGYDSLNVGVKSYPNAPYAGTDVAEDVIFLSWYSGSGVPSSYPPPFGNGVLVPLQSSTGWTGFRPLGEIITK